MRITNNMLTRGYLRNMNTNLAGLASSNQKMASQRNFMNGSENVSAASRALRVRDRLRANERNLDTITDAKGKMAAVEDNMRAINGLMQTVKERTMQGMNGAMADDDKAKIANEIRNIQKQVLQISNAKYNDKYLFNSAGGPVKGQAPFVVDPNTGVLSYNGTNVNDFTKVGSTYQVNGADFIYDGKNYIDIGLGFKVEGFGPVAKLDTNTAIESTVSGLDMLGAGMDANGNPNNIYNMLGDIATRFETPPIDLAQLGAHLEQIKTVSDNLLNSIADIGNRCTFIDDAEGRIENEMLNNQTMQNKLEAVPLQEEAIYNKDYEMSWMVTLQLGSKILPTSIFDFLR